MEKNRGLMTESPVPIHASAHPFPNLTSQSFRSTLFGSSGLLGPKCFRITMGSYLLWFSTTMPSFAAFSDTKYSSPLCCPNRSMVANC